MKVNKTGGICILTCLFVYLMIQIVFLSCDILPSVTGKDEKRMVCLFLAQSVLFAASILAVFILLFLQYLKKESASPFEALVLISDGKIKNEVLLQNRRSFVITGKKNGRGISIESTGDIGADRYLYGVCNMISGCWYLEAASPQRPVGLKRGEDNVIYRLKEETPYLLSAGDVIYVDVYKIVVRKRKHLEESKWV